jgi:predicted  nucleic acid-binding Zn-ribbon protein
MKPPTPIGSISIIDELRRAAERERGMSRGCPRCGDSGFEVIEGKGARKCDHADDDQLRERVAIEVEHLPADQAQAEFERRIS